VHRIVTAEIRVFTSREGLLARVGHDLKLSTRSITLERSGTRLHARIDASRLDVDCAMRDGVPDPRGIRKRDQAEILRNLRGPVLDVGRHPEIVFEGEATDEGLSGVLTLRGVRRPVSLRWVGTGPERVAEGIVDHRDFGVPKFTALMGTLRVDPRVRVQVVLSS
jgi:polyisoprenoid-binding protein YceI